MVVLEVEIDDFVLDRIDSKRNHLVCTDMLERKTGEKACARERREPLSSHRT